MSLKHKYKIIKFTGVVVLVIEELDADDSCDSFELDEFSNSDEDEDETTVVAT